MISKLANFLTRMVRQLSSTLRKWKIRIVHPNCRIGRGVEIGSNVLVQVSDGGIIEIGDRTSIKSNVVLVCKRGKLSIGPDTFIGWGTVICANESIDIQQDCLIAEHVTIRDQNHGIEPGSPYRTQPSTSAPIQIGSNVWIGAKATILPGVTIGADSVVGANAVVNKSVDTKVIVGGVPAKLIRPIED